MLERNVTGVFLNKSKAWICMKVVLSGMKGIRDHGTHPLRSA